MWPLVFAILALVIGIDLRRRAYELCYATLPGSTAYSIALNADVAGGWISFLGAIFLNIAVWNLF